MLTSILLLACVTPVVYYSSHSDCCRYKIGTKQYTYELLGHFHDVAGLQSSLNKFRLVRHRARRFDFKFYPNMATLHTFAKRPSDSSMSSPRQFGESVPEVSCTVPPHESLTGRFIQLVPTQAAHADQLFTTLGGERNASLYYHLQGDPLSNVESYRDRVSQFIETKTSRFWTIQHLSTGDLVGFQPFSFRGEKDRVAEIGIMLSPTLHRSAAATESLYLIVNKAFESGFRRLEWKCDALNDDSRNAALRFGFVLEGVFRQHMIVKGRNRDTAWLAMIDTEWPIRKAALERWLSPENFDEDGRQKQGLRQIRGHLEEELVSKEDTQAS